MRNPSPIAKLADALADAEFGTSLVMVRGRIVCPHVLRVVGQKAQFNVRVEPGGGYLLVDVGFGRRAGARPRRTIK